LLTLDTTRPDHLGCYGYGPETSPHLDAFASEALVFETCQASAPITLPSHCSILTGLEPPQHGVRNNGIHILPEDVTTLAEALQANGYATGAVVASIVLARHFGLAQGFDDFDDDISGPGAGNPLPERVAEEVTRRGLAWIRAHGAAPWFAWLHYFDPHDPYHPPSPFAELLPQAYDGEIAYLDAHLGGLFRELKRMGQWATTLIVVTADHGEGLGEHDEATHSLFLYSTTIDVPLLVKFPSGGAWQEHAFSPRRVAGLTATVDIAPTILEAVGLPDALPADVAGRSLVDLLRAGTPAREQVYFESLVPELDYGWAPYFGLRTERWKLILAPQPELYDEIRDPHELENIHDREAQTASTLTATLNSLIGMDRFAPTAALDEARIEQLRSLGYVAGGGSRAPSARQDAKEMGWALEALDRARAHMARREVEPVTVILRDVLAQDPTNRYAQRVLVHNLLLAGESQEALALCDRILAEQPDAADRDVVGLQRAEALLLGDQPRECLAACERLLKSNPTLEGNQLLRARALVALNDLDGARRAAEQEGQNYPRSPLWATFWARTLMGRGRTAAAETFLASALGQYPGNGDLYAMLGRLRLEQGRLSEAGHILQQVLAADPTHPRARFRMGLLMLRLNNPRVALEHMLRAVAAMPGNREFQAQLGLVLIRGRNYPKAALHLEKAVRLGDDEPDTYFALGSAYAALGRKTEARRQLEEALTQDPDDEMAHQIRMQLDALGS